MRGGVLVVGREFFYLTIDYIALIMMNTID